MSDAAIELRIDDLRDSGWRTALLALLARVFGNDDIALFAGAGRWDPTYRSIAYWHADRCVANVGVFDMPLIIDDAVVPACGVQSVATDPQLRGRGLFSSLMREATRFIDARCACSLLFSARPGLYERFGYRIVNDDVFVLRRAPSPARRAPAPRSLSAENPADGALLERRIATAAPVSRRFAPTRGAMFWYNELRSGLRRVHELALPGVLAVFDHEGDRLRLLDVLADRLPPLDDVLAAIGSSATTVEVWFTPDQSEASFDVVPRCDGDYLMVRGPFPIEGQAFAFPPTAYF